MTASDANDSAQNALNPAIVSGNSPDSADDGFVLFVPANLTDTLLIITPHPAPISPPASLWRRIEWAIGHPPARPHRRSQTRMRAHRH